MIEQLKNLLNERSVALLGYGREGRSSYTLIRKVLPDKKITIIDENEMVRNDSTLIKDPHINFITGMGCMQHIDKFDVAIKSPGIPSNTLPLDMNRVHMTSQTDIFLHCYGKQCIGITGTKGKSTTSSLVYHILTIAGRNALLVGNIGIPPFDCIDKIQAETIVVLELSSHQLEYVSNAPHIAVLLNLFQEHLDHYYTYEEYKSAKFNIGKYQSEADYFIYNKDNETLTKLIEKSGKLLHKPLAFSLHPTAAAELTINNQLIELHINDSIETLYDISEGQPLKGQHNLYNIMAAAVSCFLIGMRMQQISDGIRSFNGLEHRIEAAGNYAGILWYNDSIATIPEATIEAVRTLQNVDTLILGGFDRGIEYHILYPFFKTSGISNIIFVGEAGSRMMNEFEAFGNKTIRLLKASDYKQVVAIAAEVTEKGKICLLSPAAASYDMFQNFEERGNTYKKNVRDLGLSHE